MKLQVFLYSKNGFAQTVADALSEKFNCKCDQIPPAYQCHEEKLVFIVYEKYGSLDKKMVNYIKEMDSKKVQNISFIEISNTGNEGFQELTSLVSGKGVNVSGTFGIVVKNGLFSKGKLTEAQVQDALKFADEEGKKHFDFLRRQG